MARVKQTAKKVPKGKGKSLPGKGKGKRLPVPKKITVRRFSQGVRCLREIRKAVKALYLTIPRLPFQRLCREICEERSIGKRWRRDALDCLQEAAEDFLIEFYQDAYICAAHAKRVTLMDKDFVTLRRLRYRFSKLLEPLPIRDEKTFNILNIPPYRKPKPGESELKIEEVTHERDTRSARQAGVQREEASQALRKEEELLNQLRDKEMRIVLEDELPSILNSLSPEQFVVRVFSPYDQLGRDDYITLDKDSLIRMKDKSRELNDIVVLATMRYFLLFFLLVTSSVSHICIRYLWSYTLLMQICHA